MLQGFVGFIVGVLLTVVSLAYQPQLIGDVQQGLDDLRHGAAHLADRNDNDDVALSLSRRFARDETDSRYSDDQASDDGDRRDDSYRNNSADSDAYVRGRVADHVDADTNKCLGRIALENRSNHDVEVHLHGQGDRDQALATDNGDETVEIRPGAREEREVRARGDCDHFNSPGALTVEAEICPLNAGQHAGTCHTENLPVNSGPSETARDDQEPERQAAAPRG